MEVIKGLGVPNVDQEFQKKSPMPNTHVQTTENNSNHQSEQIGVVTPQSENIDLFKENLEKLKKIFRGEAEFKIDRDTNMVVIKIKDPETGEIIRQIPPELAVKLAKNIQELLGVLMDERV
ncbi:MAG: flagellar protein FlaG [Fervidobacterium sp.]|uniref:Flagellar protein FlaG n=1 Tax=Fervidobacterium gondwanense DSM 13020 TaxID=1121883 RepID=A0A1M7S5C0_FERGO|nr:flagellar protein FlaG [Fervidobacterium gondwanense]UXF00832.1 flagellar protein FlaG [Fervidobacterium riparium]SHN53648.1 flagellar protein FlaG [Fervidobacterium gondwanense DSM 13020]